MDRFKRCIPCNGSGRVMGGGMMMKDCYACDGLGRVPIPEADLECKADIRDKRNKRRKEVNE